MAAQTRKLAECVKNYDGEVAILKYEADWQGNRIDKNDPQQVKQMVRQVCGLPGILYRRHRMRSWGG